MSDVRSRRVAPRGGCLHRSVFAAAIRDRRLPASSARLPLAPRLLLGGIIVIAGFVWGFPPSGCSARQVRILRPWDAVAGVDLP